MCENLGALTTAGARELWICWRRFGWHLGSLLYSELQ